MKKWIIVGLVFLGVIGGVILIIKFQNPTVLVSPEVFEKPLDKYTLERLGKREYKSEIIIGDEVSPGVFNFHFDSDGKKVTGLAHIPKSCQKCPVIVQFRGYVERSIYQPGVGTKRTAEVFAKNGFISLAPDGLGYGGSDNPSEDVFEERFQTYTSALNLLSAVSAWQLANPNKIGIWGHSNGGQIALTVLEISGKAYPTVLWAPVSKPFPYSILYYTDEADDRGKALRRKLADFERDYDVELYNLTNYLEKIQAPVLLQQGSADEAVPQKWSDELVKNLRQNPSFKINYLVYPGADHNLQPLWNQATAQAIQFFVKNLVVLSDK